MEVVETEIRSVAVIRGDVPSLPPQPPLLNVRLAVLIFLAFTVIGSWMPVFSLHLKNLHFSPEATAWASATNAIGAILAPLIWGQIADRWLATDRCISLCALVSGIGLWYLASVTDPLVMVLGCVVLWFFLIPVMGLTGAFIFRQLEHPDRDFSKIRVWGTLGWMAANWLLTSWLEAEPWLRGSADPHATDLTQSMRLASVMAFVVALYALTVPHAPPNPRRDDGPKKRFWFLRAVDAPLQAMKLFRQWGFVVYAVCMFGFYVTMSFTIQLNALLLKEIGLSAKVVPLCLTICQVLEVALLVFLPIFLTRFGVRWTMSAGALAWTLGLTALSIGNPTWLVLAALSTSGIFICCFVIAGQVFVNRQAPSDSRASAQGLLVFINGSGLLLGHLLVGVIRDWTGDRYDLAYRFAAMFSAALFIIFAVAFRIPAPPESPREILVPASEMPYTQHQS